jgi:hypothetical protein
MQAEGIFSAANPSDSRLTRMATSKPNLLVNFSISQEEHVQVEAGCGPRGFAKTLPRPANGREMHSLAYFIRIH